jgi:hypothetical protein
MSYTIADEPIPSETFGNLVFRPSAPLLAMMTCGAWLAWPWFVVNSIALGSPTKRREIAMCLAGLGGSIVLGALVYALVGAGIIESRLGLELALLAVIAWKLGIAYAVCTVQSRTFSVYTYYGGAVRGAYYVLAAGMYLRAIVLGASEDPLWVIIVAGGL